MGNAGLGKRIAEFRTAKGMTQSDLARALGVSRSAVSMWEKGANEPNLEMLGRIADVFGIHVSRLTQNEAALRARISSNAWAQSKGSLDEALRWQEVYDEFGEPLDVPREDIDRLEALHQNPRLRLLFDRQRRMSDADVEAMLAIADRIVKEDNEN